MNKEQTPSGVRWLYRYVFRGIGVVFVIGILTWLYLFYQAGARK